mmetsp:Transcript_9/g.13  ORF Transcript_9/g.13 Transcript_9/m.13 type:complete len:138 (+) Transcript_9:45-458(+)
MAQTQTRTAAAAGAAAAAAAASIVEREWEADRTHREDSPDLEAQSSPPRSQVKPKKPARASREDESNWKLCCYALIDLLACLGRGLWAAWFGCKWATKRCCYPIKEYVFEVIDRWTRWYYPYKARVPSKGDIPGFQY